MGTRCLSDQNSLTPELRCVIFLVLTQCITASFPWWENSCSFYFMQVIHIFICFFRLEYCINKLLTQVYSGSYYTVLLCIVLQWLKKLYSDYFYYHFKFNRTIVLLIQVIWLAVFNFIDISIMYTQKSQFYVPEISFSSCKLWSFSMKFRNFWCVFLRIPRFWCLADMKVVNTKSVI